jgi:hypothetical protein
MRLVKDAGGSSRQQEAAHDAPGVPLFQSGDPVTLLFGDRGANPSIFVAFRRDRLWVDIRHPDGTVAPYSIHSIRPCPDGAVNRNAERSTDETVPSEVSSATI